MGAGQLPHEHVLRTVGVLILVDHHEAEAVRVAQPHVRNLLEELNGLEEEVVEVDGCRLAQALLVARVELPNFSVARVPGGVEGLGAFHPVLGLADAAQHHAWLEDAVIKPEFLDELLDDGLLVGRVVDREVAGQADVGGLASQEACAHGVERGDPHGAAIGIEQGLDALAHFPGGLVGECDSQQLVWPRMPFGDQVRDAMRDDAGLAGAGAGKNEQRALDVSNRGLLLVIER